jgi:serine/arginine repetitive matrix protein 2
LSDLISRLDLSATPDAKNPVSPTMRRIPAWADESPSKRGPHTRRNTQPTLTTLKGYDQLSFGKPTSSFAPRRLIGDSQAESSLFDASTTFNPMLTFDSSAKTKSQRRPKAFLPPAPAGLSGPEAASRGVRGHQYPRPRTTKESDSTLAKSSVGSERSARIPIASRRAGMRGTMGDDSMLAAEDSDGPDSDIPDELQMIIAGQSEDEGALPSPGMPPTLPLPSLVQPAGLESAASPQVVVTSGSDYSDEAETTMSEEELERGSRKSFDFTAELGQLKSGSRNSFVEALVTAFKTPGGSGMEVQLDLSLNPLANTSTVAEQPSAAVTGRETIRDEATTMEGPHSRTPTFAQYSQPVNKKSSGQLNLDFRFGNSHDAVVPEPSNENRTANASSLSNFANTTFAISFANLTDMYGGSSASHERNGSLALDSDTSSLHHAGQMETSRSRSHTRDDSEVSQSMSSLGNILHSVSNDPFAFNHSQSWSQSADASRTTDHAHETIDSIPSMSSVGQVISGGQEDPFDYDMLMRELDEASSMIEESSQGLERSVARRRRNRMSAESDRSSFYGRNSAAPPVSYLNRAYGRHLGHRPEQSVDSFNSDHSGQHMARPGLGDKMFQTGIPLPSIMASPSNSEMSGGQRFSYGEPSNNRHSYVSDQRRDSYFSDYRNSYAPSAAEQRRMSFMSYDSMMDAPGDERRHSIDLDSL